MSFNNICLSHIEKKICLYLEVLAQQDELVARIYRVFQTNLKSHIVFKSEESRIRSLLLIEQSDTNHAFSFFDILITDLLDHAFDFQCHENLPSQQQQELNLPKWTFAEVATLLELGLYQPDTSASELVHATLAIAETFAKSCFRVFSMRYRDEIMTEGDATDYFILYRLVSHCQYPLHVASYLSYGFRYEAENQILDKDWGHDREEAKDYAIRLSEFLNRFIGSFHQKFLTAIQINKTGRDRYPAKVCDHVIKAFIIQTDPIGETVFGINIKCCNDAVAKAIMSLMSKKDEIQQDDEDDPNSTKSRVFPSSYGFWHRQWLYATYNNQFIHDLVDQSQLSSLLLQPSRGQPSPLLRHPLMTPGPFICKNISLASTGIVLQDITQRSTTSAFESYPRSLVEICFGCWVKVELEDAKIVDYDDEWEEDEDNQTRKAKTSWQQATLQRPSVDSIEPVPKESQSREASAKSQKPRTSSGKSLSFRRTKVGVWDEATQGPLEHPSDEVLGKSQVTTSGIEYMRPGFGADNTTMMESFTSLPDDTMLSLFTHHTLRDQAFKLRAADYFLKNSAFFRHLWSFIFFWVELLALPQFIHFMTRENYPNYGTIMLRVLAVVNCLFVVGLCHSLRQRIAFSSRRSASHQMSFLYCPTPLMADHHSKISVWELWLGATLLMLVPAAFLYLIAVFVMNESILELSLHLLSLGHVFGIFTFVDFYLIAAAISTVSSPRTRGLFTEVDGRALRLVPRKKVAQSASTDKVLYQIFKVKKLKRFKFREPLWDFLAYLIRSALLVPFRLMTMVEVVLLDTLKFLVFFALATMMCAIALTNVYDLAKKQDPLPVETEEALTTTASASFTLFFAMFGLADVSIFHASPYYQLNGNYDHGTRWGLTIFGFYLSVIVILMLNLLISLMVRSAEIVNDRLPVKAIRKGVRSIFLSSRLPGLSAIFGPFLAINLFVSIGRWCLGKPPTILTAARLVVDDLNPEENNFYLMIMQRAMMEMWTIHWTPDKFLKDPEEDEAPIHDELVNTSLFSDLGLFKKK